MLATGYCGGVIRLSLYPYKASLSLVAGADT